MRRALIALCALALPGRAEAHLVGVEFGEFYAGALHLALAPEHLAGLVALALVAALQPRKRARWMLAGLPAGLLSGLALAVVWPAAGEVDPLIALSLAVPAVIGLAALRLPAVALAGLAGLAGAVHGLANGLSISSEGVDPWLYGGGVFTSGTVIGTLAIALASGAVASHPYAPLADRVLCSWLTAIGTVLFGLSVAGAA